MRLGDMSSTLASDVAVFPWGAGVAAPVLVVNLEQPVVARAILVDLADDISIAVTLVLH